MGRDRRKYRKNLDITMDLDLTSMMNLVMVLIPCLLICIAFLKLTKIETHLALSESGPPGEDIPLGLGLFLSDDGYILHANEVLAVEALADLRRADGKLFIPVVTREVSCGYYLGTWPPPRHLNRFSEACRDASDTKWFRVYDQIKLTEALYQIKKVHPGEEQINMTAVLSVEYEAITNDLDASSSCWVGALPTGNLFPTVILEPCDL